MSDPHGLTFMDKVRAYRSKQKGRSGSISEEIPEYNGPLQQGLIGDGKHQNGKQASLEEQNFRTNEFFKRVSEAKVGFKSQTPWITVKTSFLRLNAMPTLPSLTRLNLHQAL